MCLCMQSLSLAMSSDDDFDAAAYKTFEDQLYEEQSLSGLVMFWFVGVFFLLGSSTGSGIILSLALPSRYCCCTSSPIIK